MAAFNGNGLIGRTVTAVRLMTKDEMARQGWTAGCDGPPPVLEFDDGTVLIPSRDTEQNGPGWPLIGLLDGQTLGVHVRNGPSEPEVPPIDAPLDPLVAPHSIVVSEKGRADGTIHLTFLYDEARVARLRRAVPDVQRSPFGWWVNVDDRPALVAFLRAETAREPARPDAVLALERWHANPIVPAAASGIEVELCGDRVAVRFRKAVRLNDTPEFEGASPRPVFDQGRWMIPVEQAERLHALLARGVGARGPKGRCR